jgi:hypothetical protein
MAINWTSREAQLIIAGCTYSYKYEVDIHRNRKITSNYLDSVVPCFGRSTEKIYRIFVDLFIIVLINEINDL